MPSPLLDQIMRGSNHAGRAIVVEKRKGSVVVAMTQAWLWHYSTRGNMLKGQWG